MPPGYASAVVGVSQGQLELLQAGSGRFGSGRVRLVLPAAESGRSGPDLVGFQARITADHSAKSAKSGDWSGTNQLAPSRQSLLLTGDTDPGYMSRTIRKFRKDKFDT